MASRKIEDLDINLQPLALRFLKACENAGLDIIVTCTYRTAAAQDELYAQGRTKPGEVVTRAKGGKSDHNFEINGRPASRAFDIVPLVHGKCMWDKASPVWATIGNIWSHGFSNGKYYLDWYGKKGADFYELPHFCLKIKQYTEDL